MIFKYIINFPIIMSTYISLNLHITLLYSPLPYNYRLSYLSILIMLCTVECIIFILGVNAIISVLLGLKEITSSLRSNKSLDAYGKNSWGLVTASTDGIGQGFAVTLAKQGSNIIQVGRNPEKLASTGNDLKSK